MQEARWLVGAAEYLYKWIILGWAHQQGPINKPGEETRAQGWY